MTRNKVLWQAIAGLLLLLLTQASTAKYTKQLSLRPNSKSVTHQSPVPLHITSHAKHSKSTQLKSTTKMAPTQLAPESSPGANCISCHANNVSPGTTEQWHGSRHAKAGITCIQCHGAGKEEVDSWLHKGSYIASTITPQDCAKCHTKEATEFMASHHSTASLFIGSLDNYLGAFVEGHQATVSGCKQCHGSRLKITKHFQDGTSFDLDMEEVSSKALANFKGAGKDPMIDKEGLRLEMKNLVNQLWQPYANKSIKPERAGITIDKDTWPNSGMGRINPDGSMGNCNACHSRHTFSKALARQPDNCGKCHMGPDHPQIEIYNESKHGIAFRNRLSEMNLDHPKWVVGKDYSAAPTCATCHMSATPNQPVTHDVGLRISYTLRPIVSKLTTSHSAKLDDFGEVEKFSVSPEEKRKHMQDVCSSCHGPTHVKNFYDQYDALVALYNGKFATPALKIMDYIKAHNYIDTKVPFGSEIEWKFYELWHHEGRRMRMGASMMGPDYTQWHGAFEVARNFYFHFLPLAEEIAEKKGDKELKQLIVNELSSPEHAWMKGLSAEERRRMLEFYQKRYGENSALIQTQQ